MPIFMQMGVFLIMALLANGKVLISGKARVNNPVSALIFNSIIFGVVGLSTLSLAVGKPLSWLTVASAAVYAVLSVAFQLFYIMALEKGPISIIVLIANFATVITAVVGTLVFNEGFRITGVIGLLLIIISMLLTIKKGEDKKDNKGFVFGFIAMFASAGATLVQRFHQKTEFAGERNSFTSIAYLFAMIIAIFILMLLKRKKRSEKIRIRKSFIISGIATGVVLALYQLLLIYMTGVSSALFMYPILIVLTMSINIAMCRIVFKERLTLQQKIGFVIGAAAVIIISF